MFGFLKKKKKGEKKSTDAEDSNVPPPVGKGSANARKSVKTKDKRGKVGKKPKKADKEEGAKKGKKGWGFGKKNSDKSDDKLGSTNKKLGTVEISSEKNEDTLQLLE